jgi:hypothetical protein
VNKLCKSKSGNVCKKSMFVGMDIHKNYLQVAVLDEEIYYHLYNDSLIVLLIHSYVLFKSQNIQLFPILDHKIRLNVKMSI